MVFYKRSKYKLPASAISIIFVLSCVLGALRLSISDQFSAASAGLCAGMGLTMAKAAEMEGECDAADESCSAGVIEGEEGDDIKDECVDTDGRCSAWAGMGECDKNPNYMLKFCAVSCNSCPETYASTPEDRKLLGAVANYGEPQKVEGTDGEKTMDVIRKTVAYMRDEIYSPDSKHGLSPGVISECINKEALCAFWAAIGECEANKAYMKVRCAPSCQSCHMIDFDSRCPPLSPDIKRGLLPGDLNAMFERIVATAPGNQTKGSELPVIEGMTNYTVTIHSRPEPVEGEPIISRERDLNQPPWILTFDNFLTDEECERLIQLGHINNYERSKDVGEIQADGSYDSVESVGRTSENTWCSYRNKCRNDPVATRIHDRISKMTGLPHNNSEDFQLLKYEIGQFYRPHHDYIDHQKDRQCGPRVLTFFLYLSDVEEGGATNFNKLNIAVKPKRGRALLWPSVLDSDPSAKDPRTDHEAQDVIKGLKFGANAWLHLNDYLKAQELGCT